MTISRLKTNAVAYDVLIWATFTEGSSTNFAFSDITDTKNYRLGKLTSSTGNLVVATAGYAEVFMISGGGAKDTARPGSGGRILRGMFWFDPGTLACTVGAGAVFGGTNFGETSTLGSSLSTGAAAGYAGNTQSTGAGSSVAAATAGLTSTFSGSSVTYGAVNTNSGANTGASPNTDNTSGYAGIVMVRTPR